MITKCKIVNFVPFDKGAGLLLKWQLTDHVKVMTTILVHI